MVMQAPPRLLTRILHSDHKEVISPNDPAQVRRLQCPSLSQLPLNPNPESAFQETRKDFFFFFLTWPVGIKHKRLHPTRPTYFRAALLYWRHPRLSGVMQLKWRRG